LLILNAFQDDDSLNASNLAAAKSIKPTDLLTSIGLQASYQDLDNIFDNSDESNDTVSIATDDELDSK